MERVRNQIGYQEAVKQGLTGYGIGIGVLDSGIFLHPDFDYRVRGFRDFVYGKKGPYDDLGHGTHVCGILAGNGNLSGGKYMGMAPKADLYVGKVLDKQGNGDIDILLQGLEWLLENKNLFHLKLINVSVGTKSQEEDEQWKEKEKRIEEMEEKIYRAGILLVAAAGNFGPKPKSLSLLGEDEDTISVGCHDGAFRLPGRRMCEDYSGRGPSKYVMKKPDIVAPGTEIVSCGKRTYVKKSGTSMSTPIITGALALAMEKYPDKSPEEVKRKLIYSARDLGEAFTKQGWGMLDLRRLLN